MTVARYTPQAVLLANVEEARYTALMTEDGKTMIEAAYAVRNSQRSFVAVTLPANATLWSVSIDGRPVKPGRTTEGALLLPILRERVASGATSVVRLFYVDRGARWSSDGAVALRLPVVDLPVSRTGLQAYYSPRFRLTLEPGPFRSELYAPPVSAALRSGIGAGFGSGIGTGSGSVTGPGWGGGVGGGAYGGRVKGGVAGGVAGGIVGGLPEAPPPPGGPTFRAEISEAQAADRERKDLLTQFQRSNRAGAISGVLPIDVRVPAVGPSLYAAAELTPEGKAPDVRFMFKREVK